MCLSHNDLNSGDRENHSLSLINRSPKTSANVFQFLLTV